MSGGKGGVFDNDWLKLVFQGVPIPNIADNAASAPLTQLYLSLHTADPGVGGAQNTNEAAYVGYARVSVPRTSAAWTVTGNSVSPVAVVNFPTCTSATVSETETWAAAGTAASGAGKILYRGPISPGIAMAANVTPQLAVTSALTES
jgi:hypothetical protein